MINRREINIESIIEVAEALGGHLNPFTQKERFDLLKEMLNKIINP
ncbi:MAG: hypothetical protein K8R68_05490 [Bacteroidales bacterium]|nr:hypothetical protein [Bacteroidales bacterium]